jgi:hypothetical protein
MASTSGTVKDAINLIDALAAGATRPATVNVQLQFEKSLTYTNGTTAGCVNRLYYFSGSAAATPTTINLSTIVAFDGGIGFTHIRELRVYNDATTDGYTLTCFGGTTPFAPHLSGTTPQQIIDPGGVARISKWYGTAGHAVSTTINLKIDPGANTIAFRVVIAGYGA